MSEKRMYHRVVLSLPAEVVLNQQRYNAHILDVSIKGLRINLSVDDFQPLSHAPTPSLKIYFRANEDGPLISIEGTLLRIDNDQSGTLTLGCQIDKIGIDSFTVLRHIIQMNATSPNMSAQDVSALVSSIYSKASSASLS